jgi:methionine sulfoxide reductase heme-binding subunit
MIAAASSQVWWWLARASGLVAWAAAAAAVTWGLALSSKAFRKHRLPAWLLDLHRYLGTLTLVFIGVHLSAILLDSYVHFTVGDLIIPMSSSWRPRAVAWGIVTLDLILVVQVTSWLMRWLPRRVWHGVHLLSFVVLVTGTVHGALAGADRDRLTVQLGALALVVVVVGLAGYRVMRAWGARDEPTPEPVGDAPPELRTTPPESTLDPALTERLARLNTRVRTRAPERTTAARD